MASAYAGDFADINEKQTNITNQTQSNYLWIGQIIILLYRTRAHSTSARWLVRGNCFNRLDNRLQTAF